MQHVIMMFCNVHNEIKHQALNSVVHRYFEFEINFSMYRAIILSHNKLKIYLSCRNVIFLNYIILHECLFFILHENI